MAKLKEFCTINPKAPVLTDDLEVSFVPMPRVGEQGEFDPSEIKEYRKVKKGFTNFQNGDVLFAKITPCMENGKGAIAKALKNGYGFGSTEFHVLRPDYSKVTSEWLYYLTSWGEFRKDAECNMTGSAGQKRVPKTFLENYDVNLPELQKQQEMVKILSRIGELIALRKEQLAKLDQLVKSRFIELFGDMAHKSDKVFLEELSDFVTVGIANSATHAYADDGIVMLRNQNIKENYLDDNDLIHITPEFAKKYGSKQLEENDILVIRTGYPGVACLVPKKYEGCQTFTTLIVRLKDASLAHANYVCHYINSRFGKDYVEQSKVGVAQQNFGAKALAKMPIVVPPMELQEQFATFVEQTDKSKLVIQQSLGKLELLKKSLMQEYFG